MLIDECCSQASPVVRTLQDSKAHPSINQPSTTTSPRCKSLPECYRRGIQSGEFTSHHACDGDPLAVSTVDKLYSSVISPSTGLDHSITQSLSHSVTRSAASTRSSGSNEARRLELGDYPVPTDTLYCRYALPPYAYVFMRLVIASFHSPAILLASQQNRAGDERPWKTAPSVAMTMMMMMMMPLIAGDRFPRPSQHRLRGRGPGVVVE